MHTGNDPVREGAADAGVKVIALPEPHMEHTLRVTETGAR